MAEFEKYRKDQYGYMLDRGGTQGKMKRVFDQFLIQKIRKYWLEGLISEKQVDAIINAEAKRE